MDEKRWDILYQITVNTNKKRIAYEIGNKPYYTKKAGYQITGFKRLKKLIQRVNHSATKHHGWGVLLTFSIQKYGKCFVLQVVFEQRP